MSSLVVSKEDDFGMMVEKEASGICHPNLTAIALAESVSVSILELWNPVEDLQLSREDMDGKL